MYQSPSFSLRWIEVSLFLKVLLTAWTIYTHILFPIQYYLYIFRDKITENLKKIGLIRG